MEHDTSKVAILQAGNWFFILFHTALVVFNCIGWAWKKTRRLNLISLGLTMVSWFVMGLWNGSAIVYAPTGIGRSGAHSDTTMPMPRT